MGLLAGGQVAPVIARVMSLDDAARAHELLEAGAVAGKIVLTSDAIAGSGAEAARSRQETR